MFKKETVSEPVSMTKDKIVGTGQELESVIFYEWAHLYTIMLLYYF